MAIVSISRLQHRRGLKADLPANLNEAELGWCLDTRQLYIGNGNTYMGNSQILTQWSPNDQIITHAYVGDTGISASGTVQRTLGSILDDYLNVKDYGAAGDGVTDDTAAIQQAINDEWARISSSNAAVFDSRNVINFPAGNYAVSGTINLLPYITIAGEGVNRTNIALMSGSLGPVFTTADSLGQTGANIGTNGAVLPTSISVKSMNIDGGNDPTNPVISLQRCSGVTLSSIEVLGAWTEGNDPSTASPGVLIESLGNAVVTSDISFTGVNIKNCSNAIITSDPVQRINVNGSQMVQCYSGISLLGGSNGPSNIQINTSEFRDISSYALYVETYNRGVTSLNNNYTDVGIVEGVPAIYWDSATDSCSSISDVFSSRAIVDQIHNGNSSNDATNIIINPQRISINTQQPTTLQCALLPNITNASTSITYAMQLGVAAVQIQYSITAGTYRRAGTLLIISDGVTAQLADTSVELNSDATITFGTAIAANVLTVTYTNASAYTGTLSYTQTYWNN